jgi:hypothetical protein
MGFGFNLFCVFLLLPLTLLLVTGWGITGKNIFAKATGLMWGGVLLLVVLTTIGKMLAPSPFLKKNDFYGDYFIDRECFPGKQADWQYESFRFVISSDDVINFYEMRKGQEIKFYRGFISTVEPEHSARLVLHMQQPTHHILSTDPTIYRNNGSFYLVFDSPKFKNVFFKKGEWQPLSK